ncbi:MAG: aldo/keto reductase [Clostridia bacterium]|nr:aldo/keto reductase [Clostridia bacterium]
MNRTGFGLLRLPMSGDRVDQAEVCRLADRFLELGGSYFDTAYTYLGGESERAIREAVVKRHPREDFRIADKLPSWLVHSREDCARIFREQLERCGVDFFDVYLLHGLDRENYAACEAWDGFGFLRELKKQGRARRIGFSYHDDAHLLDRILTEHPEVELVQLQINYLDWESAVIQSRRCWEAARKHGVGIVVMEPVKGGGLASLADEIFAPLRALDPEASPARWALRFASSLPGVETVLSGMNAFAQIEDNLRDMPPLTDGEFAALMQAAECIRSVTAVGCTGCSYCLDGCPQRIPIPACFALYNEYRRSPGEKWKLEHAYAELSKGAGACIGCGACARICPQKLDVPGHLRELARAFEQEVQ